MKQMQTFLALLCLLFLCSVGEESSPPLDWTTTDFHAQYAAAHRAYQAADYQRALELCGPNASMDPSLAFLAGWCHYSLGDLDRARSTWESQELLRPTGVLKRHGFAWRALQNSQCVRFAAAEQMVEQENLPAAVRTLSQLQGQLLQQLRDGGDKEVGRRLEIVAYTLQQLQHQENQLSGQASSQETNAADSNSGAVSSSGSASAEGSSATGHSVTDTSGNATSGLSAESLSLIQNATAEDLERWRQVLQRVLQQELERQRERPLPNAPAGGRSW